MAIAVAVKRDELSSAIRHGELDDMPEHIDADYGKAVLSLVCQVCGQVGLTYRGFAKRRPFAYRAFHVCPQCGDEREF